MSDIVDLNARRAPVVYDVTIAHHYDGTVEFSIHNVADDPRSRDAVLWAFRRISGADERINELEAALTRIVWAEHNAELSSSTMIEMADIAHAALAGEKQD